MWLFCDVLRPECQNYDGRIIFSTPKNQVRSQSVLSTNSQRLVSMLQGLYQAPGSLLDYCDSSGCLPGQIPLKGVGRGGNFTPKTIESQMGKVRTLRSRRPCVVSCQRRPAAMAYPWPSSGLIFTCAYVVSTHASIAFEHTHPSPASIPLATTRAF